MSGRPSLALGLCSRVWLKVNDTNRFESSRVFNRQIRIFRAHLSDETSQYRHARTGMNLC